MDPPYSNYFLNLGDSGDYSNTQDYQNSPFFSNSSQVQNSENLPISQNTEKQPRGTKWDAAEDIALMSAWCEASENSILGKNQKKTNLWARIKNIYDAAQAENPEKIGMRNVEQMKGRYKRLNESVQKWVGAYSEACRQTRSGMSQNDVESFAHKIYEKEVGSKFNDFVVFNEVMCKHEKWSLKIHHGTTRSFVEVGDEESGGSSKRLRTTGEGDYSNPETPTSGSTIERPIGRDAAKRKGKNKVAANTLAEEIRAFRLTRDVEIDIMKKRYELEQQKEQKKVEREQRKIELEQQKEQKKEENALKKMQLLHLNTLLQKEHLTSEEQNMKCFLMARFYGN